MLIYKFENRKRDNYKIILEVFKFLRVIFLKNLKDIFNFYMCIYRFYKIYDTKVDKKNVMILTSFFIDSKTRVFKSFKLLLIRARRLFSMMGLLLCKQKLSIKINRSIIKIS